MQRRRRHRGGAGCRRNRSGWLARLSDSRGSFVRFIAAGRLLTRSHTRARAHSRTHSRTHSLFCLLYALCICHTYAHSRARARRISTTMPDSHTFAMRVYRCVRVRYVATEPKGSAAVQLPEYKESSRDFTRTFIATGSGSHDILLLDNQQVGASAAAAAAATAASADKPGTDGAAASGSGGAEAESVRVDVDPAAGAVFTSTLRPVVCEMKAVGGNVNEVRKRIFLRHSFSKTASFYEDRLRTNIGKALKRETRFLMAGGDC